MTLNPKFNPIDTQELTWRKSVAFVATMFIKASKKHQLVKSYTVNCTVPNKKLLVCHMYFTGPVHITSIYMYMDYSTNKILKIQHFTYL